MGRGLIPAKVIAGAARPGGRVPCQRTCALAGSFGSRRFDTTPKWSLRKRPIHRLVEAHGRVDRFASMVIVPALNEYVVDAPVGLAQGRGKRVTPGIRRSRGSRHRREQKAS